MTGADAKRIPAVKIAHNRVDIFGQEQTEFPASGGQNGWTFLTAAVLMSVFAKCRAGRSLIFEGKWQFKFQIRQ